jgi:hypothetical protein
MLKPQLCTSLPLLKRRVRNGMAISTVHPSESRWATASQRPSQSALISSPSLRTRASVLAPMGLTVNRKPLRRSWNVSSTRVIVSSAARLASGLLELPTIFSGSES